MYLGMSKPNPQGLLHENNKKKKSACPSFVKERGRNDNVCEEVCIFYVLSVVTASTISVKMKPHVHFHLKP